MNSLMGGFNPQGPIQGFNQQMPAPPPVGLLSGAQGGPQYAPPAGQLPGAQGGPQYALPPNQRAGRNYRPRGGLFDVIDAGKPKWYGPGGPPGGPEGQGLNMTGPYGPHGLDNRDAQGGAPQGGLALMLANALRRRGVQPRRGVPTTPQGPGAY